MSFTKRQAALGGLLSALFVAGCGGCNNDNIHNSGVIHAAARFKLVIDTEPNRARLLLDTATGDLWQLEAQPTGGSQWVRVASAPADARALTPREILGGRSKQPRKAATP